MKLDQRLQPIQLILSDVDGVLTDGGISYDNQGVEIKKFHVRDGMGIQLWQRAGNRFGVITARSSHIVKMRMSELNVDIIRQGSADKLSIGMDIMENLGLSPAEVCFIGDDLTDLRMMRHVGLAASVADGANEVRAAAHLVTKASGGGGAIRELIEVILKSQGRWNEIVSSYREFL
jgi:3-deoxy-D-manno-octulosonate 8-phosphate phosphatase (KDO 8-P phosphatase)